MYPSSRYYFSTFLSLLLAVVFCTALIAVAEDYKSLIDKAREQLQSDQFIDALATSRGAVCTNGDDYKGHYYMAMAFMGLGKFDDALAAANRAMELVPDNAKPEIEKLLSIINARKADTSSEKATEAALADGMVEEAARLYEQAWNARQDKPDLALKAADLYANRLKQPVNAARVLRQVSKAAQGSPAADTANAELAGLATTLRQLAQVYVAIADMQESPVAWQTLQLAEAADPSYREIYEMRVQLAAKGDSAEALQNAIKELNNRETGLPMTLARMPNMAKWMGQPAFNEFLVDLLGVKQTEQLRQLIDPIGELINVPAGCFDGIFDAKWKKVCLDAFRIGKYEVTQGQYTAIMGSNPSHFQNCGVDCPVEEVSWDDAQVFIKRLNDQTGKRFRLPTEAEWEYACLSGGYQDQNYCGGSDVNSVAWYDANSGWASQPVGSRQPNALGIYDMSGNVLEWVSDWYDYSGYPSGGRNPTGPLSGTERVVRGGSWKSPDYSGRANYRDSFEPGKSASDLGFRILLPAQ